MPVDSFDNRIDLRSKHKMCNKIILILLTVASMLTLASAASIDEIMERLQLMHQRQISAQDNKHDTSNCNAATSEPKNGANIKATRARGNRRSTGRRSAKCPRFMRRSCRKISLSCDQHGIFKRSIAENIADQSHNRVRRSARPRGYRVRVTCLLCRKTCWK